LEVNLREKIETVIRMKPVIKRPVLLDLIKAQEKNKNQKRAAANWKAVSIEYLQIPI
jgi:hypothetical protein